MYQNLEDYLREIGHHLAVRDGADDILSEIKSHILEKAEVEFGRVTEETVGKIISTYGRPQQVAAKYIEGVEIISPIFKRYLFLYTGILFLCHSTMALFAYLTNISMLSFPFLYIPKMDGWQIIFYLPTAFVYDIGLVIIFLYFVTQSKKEIRIPWPKFFSLPASRKKLKTPKVAFLVFLILVFGSFLYFFIRHGTIFFASMNDAAHPIPMFGPSASFYYSALFLAMLVCEVVGYAARFISQSRWIELIKTAIILLLLQFVWNSPVGADFTKIPGLNIEQAMTAFLLVFTVLIAFRFLKNIISVIKK
ncbi:MAG: hypothetical protein ABSB78_09200 [Bacteroidota bacterium]